MRRNSCCRVWHHRDMEETGTGTGTGPDAYASYKLAICLNVSENKMVASQKK